MTKIVTTCDICGKEFNKSDIKDRELYYNIYEIHTEYRYNYQNFTINNEVFERKYDICPYCHKRIATTIDELKRGKNVL